MIAYRLFATWAFYQLSATAVEAGSRSRDSSSSQDSVSADEDFSITTCEDAPRDFCARPTWKFALLDERLHETCSLKKSSRWNGWDGWNKHSDPPRCKHFCFARRCNPYNRTEGQNKCRDDEICCDTKYICVNPVEDEFYTTRACGDPHMTGFLGQKFDFTGEDGGWYALIADEDLNVNMRVTAIVPGLPEITYITGLSVLTTDADGIDHTIVVEVKDPHNLESSCPAGVSPCLADGSLRVLLDGKEKLAAPGMVSLAPGVEISTVNLPGACRSFGFEKYWERKKLEYAAHGRRLGYSMDMGDWILGDPTATNMNECEEYVEEAEDEGDLFAHQSEHASFQIVTPKGTIRLSHGRLHQLPMRDPTDQYDLPDHITWQMNMAIAHNQVSRGAKGVLGETFVPTRDSEGEPIMTGMEAIRGTQEDYRVEGALGTVFVHDAQTS